MDNFAIVFEIESLSADKTLIQTTHFNYDRICSSLQRDQ